MTFAMPNDLDKAISTTLAVEGGWADHKADPGGKTMYGITHGTLKSAHKAGIVYHQDIRALSIDQARTIYEKMYWNPVRAGEMPRGLNALIFDIAVNSGPKAAGTRLQNALNHAGGYGLAVDGKIGPKTLSCVHDIAGKPYGIFKLLDEVSALRHLHWSRLRHWATFGKGWTRRGYRIHTEAVRMADGTV